jgi:hypothetical protein
MKRNLNIISLNQVVVAITLSIAVVPNGFAQQDQEQGVLEMQALVQQTQQQKLQAILNDKAGYIAVIVQKWEDSARTSGRWDQNYANDLSGALMNLQPENLLAAGEAPSYEAMLEVLATGRATQTVAPNTLESTTTESLGSTTNDLVYTPVTPCRIADTRNAGGMITGGSDRSFDVDGSNFSAQGGQSSSCGIPLGVAQAVVMNLTVTQPSSGGWFTAWAVGTSQPNASSLNYAANQTIANATIVPVAPGGGSDFRLYSYATAHAVVDVMGYFAAPTATALDCTTVSSALTAAPVNTWTAIDANCPSDRTATGGGYNTSEGTLGYPGVWLTSMPNGNGWRTWVDNQTSGSRSMRTYVRCCRVPGR